MYKEINYTYFTGAATIYDAENNVVVWRYFFENTYYVDSLTISGIGTSTIENKSVDESINENIKVIILKIKDKLIAEF